MSVWDWSELEEELSEVRGENQTQIVLRRDTLGSEATLPPQNVRIARTGSASRQSNEETRDTHMRMVILGDSDLDIQSDDRFNYEGDLYEVIAIRPHRNVGVRAEAERKE